MLSKGKILVVDDEQSIVEFICYNLEKAGYEVAASSNGNDAIRVAKHFNPDLILLDVMMPGKDGFQTIKELRQMPSLDATIVIFLTAMTDEKSEIMGLELGADDYITKPIKPDLLMTRLDTALRRVRREKDEESVLDFGDLIINKTKFTVSYKDSEIVLAKKEFELLNLLASKPGRVFLRNEILQKVWGTDVIVGDRTIDVHVRKIRQKMGIDLITTVKGVGYKFEMAD
ncbi:MAG: DNA-binding response regulator [Bacteroidetes bacterium 43-16]|nr:MAG: DNA-binding response regulator [Bacteroidetes bacterium 43-16]